MMNFWARAHFNDEIYFKYHQAKNWKKIGKIFKREINENAGWLDDLKSTSVPVIDATTYLL